MREKLKHRSIIGHDNDDGVFIDTFVFKQLEHFPQALVHIFHTIAVTTA